MGVDYHLSRLNVFRSDLPCYQIAALLRILHCLFTSYSSNAIGSKHQGREYEIVVLCLSPVLRCLDSRGGGM